uniref:Lariat debranching enzyme-like n=1 Tax=Phallusia mammillata TaxID=59560 RepID=A0A6F9DBD3_9ASCI|nr:lariat debranching enzyme-like [Phallusia mammillata]
MHIAVEGCCHGELDKIYETLQFIEKQEGIEIELLLCCGDFQAVRDEADLQCMAVPDKHKSMQDFWQYYSEKKTAPFLTIFIGGNHEASNYLQELPYGGWVAPNIFYLGYAGAVNYKGLRIGGVSGIFKQHDYTRGRFEKPPYTESTKRSVYHVRHMDIFRLKQLKQPMDIMMSHDWPNGIVNHGDKEKLIETKWHFERDIRTNQLGSLPSWQLLQTLQPQYWFSGHLHVKFPALVNHDADTFPPPETCKITKFLALDKCLPRRDFLQVLELPTPDNASDDLCYDAEWLAVLKETNSLMSSSYKTFILPTKGLHEKWDYSVNEAKINEVISLLGEDLKIPLNFRPDDSCLYHPEQFCYNRPVVCKVNQQTTEFCAKLEINDPLMLLLQQSDSADVSLNNSSWMTDEASEMPSAIVSNTSINPDEINLEDDDEEEEDISQEVVSEDTDKSPIPSNEEDDVAMVSSLSSMSSTEEELECGKKSTPKRPAISIAANFSMNLPAPKLPQSSTPSQASKSEARVGETFPPVTDSISVQSSGGKRSSDNDSEATEGVTAGKAKKFKRRNASFYTGPSEDETT